MDATAAIHPPRRAVIDIGTNSVKLLVGDLTGAGVLAVHETSIQTRLGQGLHPARRLHAEAIQRTAAAVTSLADQARKLGATAIRGIATSAAREALNADALVAAIRDASQLGIEIISGELEAEWGYRGVASDPALAGGPILMADAGGGSTELVLGEGGRVRVRRSFPLGTVRLLECHPVSDPPSITEWRRLEAWLNRFVGDQVLPVFGPALEAGTGDPVRVVGACGTTTILARMDRGLDTYDRQILDGLVLTADGLTVMRERLWALPLGARRRLPGLPPERADVMLTGVAIYEALLRQLRRPQLHVSLRSLRFGALLDAGDTGSDQGSRSR